MALFIGSNLKSGDWGEDYVLEKCIEYFDDSCVIYRNREVFGAQFDTCVLIPGQGIAVIEVKAWKPTSIIRIENGDSIIIRTNHGGEGSYNPTKQARGYMFSIEHKIHQKTGMTPFIFPVVCFPLISEQEYHANHIESVCEYETTILKEDLLSKAAFYKKLNLAMRNGKYRLSHTKAFTPSFLLQVRQIFEPAIQTADPDHTFSETALVPKQKSKYYSFLCYIPDSRTLDSTFVTKICSHFVCGTKLILIVNNSAQLNQLATAIDEALRHQGVVRNGDNIELSLADTSASIPQRKAADTVFKTFNCLICVDRADAHPAIPFLCIVDGQIPNDQTCKSLVTLGKYTAFNYEQYIIEHADQSKDIMIRAGAGTGKTFTMIARIGFLCHIQNCNVRELANRIVMITFTNDAADQMKQKIKTYFNNYYLLTGNVDYLHFIGLIDSMQISTIHSYAKQLISLLGQELGYGVQVSVKSGEYIRKKIIADKLDAYLIDQERLHGSGYIQRLGHPVYAIRDNILTFINNLHNKSVDVAHLAPANFGSAQSNNDSEQELHKLFANLIPLIEQEYSAKLQEENSIHLSELMSTLDRCLSNADNIDRLKQLRTGAPKFMFVDEFQDTDDTQITALQKITTLLQYKLFVVGDIKQCIYRFRGAKENAFDQLCSGGRPSQWLDLSLNKNFRTDTRLLDLFDKSFSEWGRCQTDGEALLTYDRNRDRLIGTRQYNVGYDDFRFYKAVHVAQESELMERLFQEVERQVKRIQYEEGHGKALSPQEKEIAILVRENWQADLIHKEGKRRNYTVVTNTGGDLYRSEPALDMLTLANALLHYDEADYLYALAVSNLIGGGVSKARMYQLRKEQKGSWRTKSKVMDTTQAKELHTLINCKLARTELNWSGLITSLRMEPVMQVMRRIYSTLEPWVNYGGSDTWKQDYYRQNVDLLFEQLMATADLDSLTINSLVDILQANIRSCKNVDSRTPDLTSGGIAVRCITVHKAKGLEYGSVILPYCSFAIDRLKKANLHISITEKNGQHQVGYKLKTVSENILENSFFDADTEEKEREREEMRVLYVAMTRAIRSFSWLILDNKNTMSWQRMIWEARK